MKRIFAAAAALALVCILTACGTGSPAPEGGTTTPMDENKAAGTVTIPVPEETGDTPDDASGAQAGGTYTNKTARITCKLDDSWLFYNDSQLLELNGVLTEAGGGDVASLAESGKAVYDMYAVSTDGLMTMNVTYQNLGLLSGASMTAQEYVEQAAATLPGDLAACGFADAEVQITAQDLAAERDCPTLLVTAQLQDMPMYERMVCIQSGDYIYCVTLCSLTEDVTADMAALFHRAW